MSNSWDRRSKESSKAYQALQLYLRLEDERSVRAVAQELHKSVSLCGRWSRRWDWVSRSADYDSHMAQQAARQRLRERVAMCKRQADYGALATATGVTVIRNILHKLQEAEAAGRPIELSATEAVRLLEIGVKVERLARGVPDAITELDLQLQFKQGDDDLPVDLACKVARAYLERHGGEASADAEGKGPVSQAEVANLVNDITRRA